MNFTTNFEDIELFLEKLKETISFLKINFKDQILF